VKPEWWERYENPIIRQYILDLCKAYAPRSKHQQKELYYVGWERITGCRPGKTPGYYMHIGFVGITRHYHIYIKPISHIPFTWSAPYWRAKRTTKKYFKRVLKKC